MVENVEILKVQIAAELELNTILPRNRSFMAAPPFNPAHFPTPSGVALPPAVHNPPNDDDFQSAIEYEHRVRSAICQFPLLSFT